jgi:hypothetical protein
VFPKPLFSLFKKLSLIISAAQKMSPAHLAPWKKGEGGNPVQYGGGGVPVELGLGQNGSSKGEPLLTVGCVEGRDRGMVRHLVAEKRNNFNN